MPYIKSVVRRHVMISVSTGAFNTPLTNFVDVLSKRHGLQSLAFASLLSVWILEEIAIQENMVYF